MLVAVPLFDRFTALDAIGPYEVLSRIPDTEVRFVAPGPEPVTADTGMLTIVPTATLDEVDACDVLLVPGGPGTRILAQGRTMSEWVRTMDATSTWTTSVCTGALVLAAAGLLDGLDATTHWASADLLESLGARYTPERVVEQGKVLTAAGVSAGIDMALVLTEHLAGRDVAEAIQLAIEYDPQPPHDVGSVTKARPEITELVRGLIADPVEA